MAAAPSVRRHEQPGYRACSACEERSAVNAVYSFVGGEVRCICRSCHDVLGFRFNAAGEAEIVEDDLQEDLTKCNTQAPD